MSSSGRETRVKRNSKRITIWHAIKKETSRDLCYGGEGGIRTHGTVSRTLAFEASAFNRSATSPRSLDTSF